MSSDNHVLTAGTNNYAICSLIAQRHRVTGPCAGAPRATEALLIAGVTTAIMAVI